MSDDIWDDRLSAEVRLWSVHVAELAADALIEARLLHPADFNPGKDIIAEEIFVRLCLRDFPPGNEPKLPGSQA